MAAKAAAKSSAKPMNKSEVISGISETTGLTKKQVSSVLEAMTGQMKKSFSRNGSGAYIVPGLMKVYVVKKPAVAAHKGINPFTKEETMFKAKPARNVIKVRALKNLKDMV
jgi:nucleoid DNA-binding protein